MVQTCDADENVAFIEKRAGRMEICMKKILHLIFGRFFVVAMAIILQVFMAVCRIVAAQLQVYVCQFACASDSNHCCACNRQ